MATIYASIGNTDNKLTQQEWARFVEQFRRLMARAASQVYGDWISESSASFQNACVAIETGDPARVQTDLALLAMDFRHDSIAVAHVERTVFAGGS